MARNPQAEDARPPRERIVEAAREVFRRDGIASTPLGDVAAIAGVARPHLYRYFGNREALVLEVLVAEIRRTNAERWQRISLAGPVRPLILQSLVLGHEIAHDDYLERVNYSSEALAITADLVSTEPRILDAQYEYWGPLLEYGRARREIAADLTNERIVRWFLAAHVLLAERPSLVPEGDVLAWFRDFVVPPVVVDP
jgi:AcrR family transcriptional regulator